MSQNNSGTARSTLVECLKKLSVNLSIPILTELKLGMAVNLLINTDLPISKIADALGYPSADLIIKFFKYHRSCPPGAFRKNIRSTGE